MKKLILVAAVAAFGLSVPVVSAQAEEGKVVIKSGERHHHWRGDRRKVVIIKHREHRHHHGARVVVHER